MERVPAARLRADADADAHAGRLRRPQPLHARTDEAERVHVLLHWPRLIDAPAVAGDRRRRLHRQPYRQGAPPRRLSTWSSSTTSRPGTARRRSARRSSRATSATSTPCAARSARAGRLRRDALRGAGSSLPIRCATRCGYYRQQRRGDARARSRRWPPKAAGTFVFSSTCAVYGEPVEAPLRETHPTAPINAYGQTKLAVEQRAAALRARVRDPVDPAALLQRGRRRSRRRAGRGPLARDPRHPARVRRGARRARRSSVRRGLSDAGRHLPARLRARDRPGRCARPRAAIGSSAGGASATYNVGTERPSSVREVIAAVERVDRPAVAAAIGAAPRRAIPPCSTRRPDASAQELGWVPQPAALDTIVGDAWRWHSTQPHGFRTEADGGARERAPPPARVRAPSSRAAGGGAGRDGGVRRRVGGSRRAHPADLRRGAAEPARTSLRSPSPSSSCTCSRAIGAYLSGYLMTDVGQRVVRDLRNVLFRHILGQSAAFFSLQTTGRLMSRITNDVGQVQRAVSETHRRPGARVARARRASPRCCSTTTARLALVCLTGAPLVVYPLVRLGQRVRRTTRRSQEALEQMSHVSAEAFTGHRIVKAFGAEAREAAKFERASQHFYRTSMKVTSVLSVLPPLMEFIGGVAFVAALVVRQPGDRGRAADAGRVHRLHRRAVHDVRARPRSSAASTPTCSRRWPRPSASSRSSIRTTRCRSGRAPRRCRRSARAHRVPRRAVRLRRRPGAPRSTA